MEVNKKIIGIIGLAFIAAVSIVIYEGKDKKLEQDNSKDSYYDENYDDDPYEKFLQEKVLPNMIKNNKSEVCELPQEDTELFNKDIDLGEGVIVLDNDGFIAKVNELYVNLDKYVGRAITYEGLVYKVEDEHKPVYIIGRYYEESHEDHSHENIIGLQGTYEGQWPSVDTWVQVKGIIEKGIFNDQEVPVVKIEEITVMPQEGQRKVYN